MNRQVRKERKRTAGWALWRLAAVVVAYLIATPCIAQRHSIDSLGLVDPRIGTSHDGQTYPVVGVPFGMTGWTPETRSNEGKCISPYYYNDTKITGFRGSHWLSGSCTQDYGSVTLMPTTGELKVAPDQRASRFRHASEVMSPAFYSVDLDDYRLKVELTGTTRAGFIRITFPSSGARHLLIEPNVRPNQGFIEVHPEKREIVGYNPVVRIYQGAGKPAGFNGYFVIKLDQPIADSGTWCNTATEKRAQQRGSGCNRIGAYITLAPNAPQRLLVRMGTSFTSLAEAERNLSTEEPGWNFDAIRTQTEATWRHYLSRIEVEGGTQAQQTMFYTALFHASLAPRIVSDADGTYNGFANEGRLHHAAKGTDYYDDFSLWDTFRALHPLLTILDPLRDGQMIQSLVDKGQQGSFLPIFPTWNSYTSEMIGDHAVAVIYDAYAKGIRNFNVPEAYRLVRQNAFITPPRAEYVEGKGRRALASYLRYGYIPLEDEVRDAFHQREQVSRTLEYAYDDYVAAQFASALGHRDDAALLLQRSHNWRNVLDPETRFARGRHADRSWVTPFDPTKPATFVTEANPWQYTFFVPQDVLGLIHAIGGPTAFIAKLDGIFDNHLYDQGNEPSHAIAYLYDFAGAPAKTQQRVRELMNTQFGASPDGLPGNDDAGQMSAWYVLSAMGFYPVCPGTLDYSIGSPLFSRVAIHLANGKIFTIAAHGNSVENTYIRSIQLDGHAHPGWTFSHNDILRGAALNLDMAASPATQENQ